MKKFIEKLHFITQDLSHYPHVEQVQVACEAGAKWVQYRCLNKKDEALVNEINIISSICDDWGTTLIVSNHIHLKPEIDVQGFFIEGLNTNLKQTRQQIGENYTLGAFANTIPDLFRLIDEGIDYVGLGPYAPSVNGLNNFPLINLQSYTDAVVQLKEREMDFPVLAIGGITLPDVQVLMDTGIHGIAVSSAINRSENLYEAYQEFHTLIV